MDTIDVRDVYSQIRTMADHESPEEREYIRLIWTDWDRKLSTLPVRRLDFREQLILTSIQSAALDPDLSKEARLEWLDAFPSAMYALVTGVE